MNEAAEKFAEAIKESYQALADRSVSAQELNAKLTQEFFNGVINNLRTQAQNNRALAEDLIEQQRKQQEASQALAQESVNAYMDFLNFVFARPRAGAQTARRAAQEEGEVSLRGTSGDVRRGTTPDAPITPPDEAHRMRPSRPTPLRRQDQRSECRERSRHRERRGPSGGRRSLRLRSSLPL